MYSHKQQLEQSGIHINNSGDNGYHGNNNNGTSINQLIEDMCADLK